MIDAAQRVTGKPIALRDAPRRHGDPARLVADAALARQQLGWAPQFTDLETIVAHARACHPEQITSTPRRNCAVANGASDAKKSQKCRQKDTLARKIWKSYDEFRHDL